MLHCAEVLTDGKSYKVERHMLKNKGQREEAEMTVLVVCIVLSIIPAVILASLALVPFLEVWHDEM